MSEVRERIKKVETYEITMPCRYCGVGEMKFTGECISTYPPFYKHRCNKCGFAEDFCGDKYPRIEYR